MNNVWYYIPIMLHVQNYTTGTPTWTLVIKGTRQKAYIKILWFSSY